MKQQLETLMFFVAAFVVVLSSTTTTLAFVSKQAPRNTDHRLLLATTRSTRGSRSSSLVKPVTNVRQSLFMAKDDDDDDDDDEMIMTIDDEMLVAEERMEKSVDTVLQNMNTIRTGRASPSILDLVKASYYGTPTPINQMATISVPSAQQLVVDPYDKSVISDIERAIVDADIGLTPQNDGTIIRLNIPSLTEDRRKEMMKRCTSIGEDGKISIRNIRRKTVTSIKKMEKLGDISEDESKSTQDVIQKLTDTKVKEITTIVGRKEKEVMTV